MRPTFVLVGTLLLINGISLPVLAEQYTAEELGESEIAPHKPLSSVDGFTELGKGTAGSVGLAADYSNRYNNYDKAIKLSKKALDRDPDDLDLHLTYAESLEAKLKTQEERDPELYNKCVTEWLTVLRNDVGDEAGLTYHGVGLPGIHLYEDTQRGGAARQHLKTLTGSVPRGWETNARYLKRVLKPVDTNVAGKILAQPKSDPLK